MNKNFDAKSQRVGGCPRKRNGHLSATNFRKPEFFGHVGSFRNACGGIPWLTCSPNETGLRSRDCRLAQRRRALLWRTTKRGESLLSAQGIDREKVIHNASKKSSSQLVVNSHTPQRRKRRGCLRCGFLGAVARRLEGRCVCRAKQYLEVWRSRTTTSSRKKKHRS
jgi:hypothetical protein